MEITRGDNKSFKFQRKNPDGTVIETVADELYFTVKKNYTDTTAIIQKVLSEGDVIFNGTDFYYRFEIVPSDTDGLRYQDYVYDIERIILGKKQTIAKGIFTITEEVTFASNESEA